VFRLSRPSVVEITVVQVAPTCRTWGRLEVRGHAGVNRVRFRGRVEGKLLPPGTYRLLARPSGSSRITVIRLVIAKRRPDNLRAALTASTCSAGDGGVVSAALVTSGDSVDSGGSRARNHRLAGGGAPDDDARAGGVLAAKAIGPAARAVAAEGLRVGLLIALLLAAGLLALVALPGSAIRNARVASVIVDRRLELGLTATVLMAGGLLLYLLAYLPAT
jgi:hypothetical protein